MGWVVSRVFWYVFCHYLKPLAHWAFVKDRAYDTAEFQYKPPSAVIKERFYNSLKKGKEMLNIDLESVAKQVLLSVDEVSMQVEHLKGIMERRKMGAQKATLTRKNKKAVQRNTDVPQPDVPVSDVPVPDFPGSDVPVSDVPVSDLPVSDLPVSDVPVSDVPVSDVPLSDVPLSDIPVSDVPVSDVPVSDVCLRCPCLRCVVLVSRQRI
ncbi:Hypothetical predicted protein [Paramuricea clavata]|uniref:Uncharacterized protein n=1 Tax=Paramuricea clavata TaxID=317549 RepID=A0A6S7I0T0_PARCT|nr:Hypothetical predicted protein [Paramuricea clavata]